MIVFSLISFTMTMLLTLNDCFSSLFKCSFINYAKVERPINIDPFSSETPELNNDIIHVFKC